MKDDKAVANIAIAGLIMIGLIAITSVICYTIMSIADSV